MAIGKRLEELEIYKVSMEIGECVWSIVMKWDYFSKKTLGDQLVRAADSIAFNISEGYGRFFYKENRNFSYYSRGSAKETYTALVKAKTRSLVTQSEYESLFKLLERYFRLSFGYIKSIGTTNDPG